MGGYFFISAHLTDAYESTVRRKQQRNIRKMVKERKEEIIRRSDWGGEKENDVYNDGLDERIESNEKDFGWWRTNEWNRREPSGKLIY